MNEKIKEILSYVKIIIITTAIVLFLNKFIIVNAVIPSESMENTIMTDDHVIGDRLQYIFSDPKRYDIVIFRYPDNKNILFVKRIIGLPGESVSIRDGEVYINNSSIPLDDSFLPEEMFKEDFGPYEVPDNCYFMLGDNRNCSEDSRYWSNHYVERQDILAKVWLRYYPVDQISLIK